MAEAMTALSIAATTVQFVDFSLKILSFYKEIRKSTKNATEANTEIESSVEKLQEYQKRLKPFTPGQGVSQEDVATIENARQECNETAGKILKVLQDLKPKKRWFGKIAWAAWRTHRAEAKIQSLEKKLKGRNARFREALTDVTWERVFHMLKEQEDLLQNRLLPEVKQMYNDNRAAHSITHHQLEKARITTDQKDFLRKLSFPGMSQRHESIEPPAIGTYEWIFADDSSSDDSSLQQEFGGKFMQWLSSDEKVFWISGKAGSGKSSLMAFIESHRSFEKGLKHWSKGRSLTVLTFFFWRPGLDLQKSITGLLRSLLHQLLTKKPSAIDKVCANDPALRYSDWTEGRLSRVLSEVLDLYQHADECIFFLIDGLDEFEGDYSKLLRVILPIKLRSNVRICLSSRPLNVIQQSLQTYATIRLEDLNYRDITHYVFSELRAVDYPHMDHMTKIPSRAAGIFLWAALVTKELIKCYQEDHSKATLQSVLDDMPQGLAPLFNSLFSHVDKRSHNFLLLIFQMLKKSGGNYNVNIAYITACLYHKEASSLHDFLDRCQNVERWIVLRSKGLLQVFSGDRLGGPLRGWALQDPSTHEQRQAALTDDETQSWMKLAWPRVNWLHRSAYDYIFNGETADLPKWIRQIDIAQDLLYGYAWLFRYGLLFYVSDGYALFSEMWMRKLILGTGLQTNEISEGVYQTLDDPYSLLDSSLSEESWLGSDIHTSLEHTREISRSIIGKRSMDFWLALDDEHLHDYVLSRFDLVKSSRFVHLVCATLLRRVAVKSGLHRLMLDVLNERVSIQTGSAILCAQNARGYRWSSYGIMGLQHFSWLSHGEACEAATMYELHHFIFDDLPRLGRAFSGESLACLRSNLMTLADHWHLFSNTDPASHLCLQVHFSISHALRRMDTDINTEKVTPLRLIVMRKRDKMFRILDITNSSIGFTPICIFHTSPATNLALSRYLEGPPPTSPTSQNFKGSLDAFLECREILIAEIQEDAANQLDTRQQRCLLSLVQICFFRHWTIAGMEDMEDMEDVRSISADSQSTQ